MKVEEPSKITKRDVQTHKTTKRRNRIYTASISFTGNSHRRVFASNAPENMFFMNGRKQSSSNLNGNSRGKHLYIYINK